MFESGAPLLQSYVLLTAASRLAQGEIVSVLAQKFRFALQGFLCPFCMAILEIAVGRAQQAINLPADSMMMPEDHELSPRLSSDADVRYRCYQLLANAMAMISNAEARCKD